jgi:hypothetical protein
MNATERLALTQIWGRSVVILLAELDFSRLTNKTFHKTPHKSAEDDEAEGGVGFVLITTRCALQRNPNR